MKKNYLRTFSDERGSRKHTAPSESRAMKGFRRLTARLAGTVAFLLIMSGTVLAQTAFIPVPPASNGTSANSRGPSGLFAFQRAASIYSAAELGNFNPTFPVTTIGFNIATAPATTATGTIKIYLANTADASFLRSTTWTDLIATPTPMTLVYDGPLTIPNTAGWYDIPLTTPFNYTGGGMYLAFEWTRTSAATATGPSYSTNSALVGGADGWKGVTNNMSHQAILGGTSPFRPWIRLGYTPPNNDAAVNAVYSLGKLPLNNGLVPTEITASITNMGAQPIVNRTFTLNVTGANTYTTTATVANINSFQTVTVAFPAFTPTNLGVNTITVTAPADDVAGNNSATYSQVVTPATIAYAVGDPAVITGGAGISNGAAAGMGGFFTRYSTTGTTMLSIPVVRVGIANNAPSVGKRVFAVVLDANGVQIGRSAGYTIQASDLGTLLSFNITTPPTVVNTDFYVGLAVTPGPAAYFPVGTQPETPTRTGAYYAVLSDTTFTGSTAFTQVTTLGRYVIEADLIVIPPPAVDLNTLEITGITSGCGLSSTTQVCATIMNSGGDPQSNIPVSFIVNNGSPITETIPGPIAPGDTISYCFTQTLNLSVAGTYVIKVITGMPGDANTGNDTTSITITSLANVPASINSVPANICVSEGPIQLSGLPAGGTFSGTGVTGATFDPATAGIGQHTITYSVVQGVCSGTATVTIQVDAIPVVAVAADKTICGPGSVTLTATPSSGTTTWYSASTGGSVLSTGNTFTTPNLTSSTTYYVGSANYVSSGTNTIQLGTVGPIDGVSVGAGAIGGPFTNEMIFNTSIPLRIDSVTLITDGAGTYTIGLRNTLSTNPGSIAIDSATVSVPSAGTHRVYLGIDVPTPGTGYTLGLLSSTIGSGGLFRNTAGAVYPYVNQGVISITGSAFGTDPFTSPRFYNFYNWSVSASVCESPRAAVVVTVGQLPAAPTASDVSRCGTGTVTLTATSAGSGTLLWYTSATTGSPVATGPTFTTPSLTATTTYYVADSAASGCISTRVPVQAIINAVPNAAFTFTSNGSSYNFAATSTTGTYSWTFAGGTPTSATTANPTVTFANAGTYTASLTVTANGCSATTNQVVVVAGIEDEASAGVTLYPNPTSGQVKIEVNGTGQIELVEVFNALGQVVYKQQGANKRQVLLNLSEFAEGLYTVRVSGSDMLMVKQLLLQK